MTGKWFKAAACAAATFVVTAAVATSTWAEEGKTFTLNVGGVDGPGGSVKGLVKFEGRQATRKVIRMDADKYCVTSHGDKPAADETFVFGESKAADGSAVPVLQNVFVYVSKGLEGKTFAPQGKPELDQSGCVYVPHVQGVMVNQDLLILNGDSTLHNVKVNSKNNGSFNEGMPVKGMTLTKKFAKAELGVPFKCDVHPWMTAYVHVVDNPFYAVTQADGTFELKGLPAGEYEISFHHEFDKFTPDQKTVKVKVEEGKAAEVTVTYRPPGAAAPAAK